MVGHSLAIKLGSGHHQRWVLQSILSVCGVSVEALHDWGDKSLLEELMDDFMALLASFSGRFYQLRSKRNQRRLLDGAGERLGQ